MKIQFLGAARQVTGSRYLLEIGDLRILIDSGLFQEREFLNRNWSDPPFDPTAVDFLLLTHVHLDHTGLIPRLVAQGFSAPIITTAATAELSEIVLADAAHIQLEDAHYKIKRHKKQNRKSPRPIQPLYTPEDASAATRLFRHVRYNQPFNLNKHVTVTFHDAGHILGSAAIEIVEQTQTGKRTILFSGDVGQKNKPIIRDPEHLERADYVIMESTYGNRTHDHTHDIESQLQTIINDTATAGGNLLIPTFAVERAQELVYLLGRLRRQRQIPNLLAFLDSPMAVDVTDVFRNHKNLMDADAQKILNDGNSLFRFPGLKFVRTTAESKAINRIHGSCIIMAGSGMCTAGRIKHHLVHNIAKPQAAIVFVGYQANGTLGRQIVSGAKTVRIHGEKHNVRARITQIHGFSAHADRDGLIEWVTSLKTQPKRVFLCHGEPDAAGDLAQTLKSKHNLNVEIQQYEQTCTLD